MTNSEKMTYVKALTYVLDSVTLPTEVSEKLEALREQQMKRNSSDKKPTAKQMENEALKTAILTLLEGQSPKTISEIQAMSEEFSKMSNQKVASLVRLLVEDGKLVRTEEKRKAYFQLVG